MKRSCQVGVVFKENTMMPTSIQYYELKSATYKKRPIRHISYHIKEGIHQYYGVYLEKDAYILSYNQITQNWFLSNYLL